MRVLRSDLLPHPQQTSGWLGWQRDEHVLQPPLVPQRPAAQSPQGEDHAEGRVHRRHRQGTAARGAGHTGRQPDLRRQPVSAATRARRLAWAPAVPGAAASSAAAVAALRNATGVSLAWNSPSGVADTINLNTTPAADYDLSICDSVSIECLKRLHLQSQDFPAATARSTVQRSAQCSSSG